MQWLEIVDIAGLVKGAAQGAGLGNAFLSHIRAIDGIIHVLRAFDDADIIHVEVEACLRVDSVYVCSCAFSRLVWEQSSMSYLCRVPECVCTRCVVVCLCRLIRVVHVCAHVHRLMVHAEKCNFFRSDALLYIIMQFQCDVCVACA